MKPKDTTPSINKTAFMCPHCGTYTSHVWFRLGLKNLGSDSGNPNLIGASDVLKVEQKLRGKNNPEEMEQLRDLLDFGKKALKKTPYYWANFGFEGGFWKAYNCHFSECFTCKEITIWVYDKIVFPNTKVDIPPNPDLPPKIQDLFDEAREIVDLSPRGAAALLRLCIQYLCKELGGKGRNIDEDIASFVKDGLNPVLQQSLDVVRVIGNEAVHPGEICLNDNKKIAFSLFGLINSICEQMISHPKHVRELYQGLPQKKREAIDNRDQKSKDQEGDS